MSEQDKQPALESKDVRIDNRINELMTALRDAERKLRDQESLIAQATDQTAESRKRYSQANERVEILRRRLDTKEIELDGMQTKIDAGHAELKSARESVAERDLKITELEQALSECQAQLSQLQGQHQSAESVDATPVEEEAPTRVTAEQDDVLKDIDKGGDSSLSNNPAAILSLMSFALESIDQPEIVHRVRKAVTTIGRISINDIVINSKSVSRRHARLVTQPDGLWIIDMQSSNGCSVNGERVSGQLLCDGDTVVVGECGFKFMVSHLSEKAEELIADETLPLLDESVFLYAALPKSKSEKAASKPGRTNS